MLAAAKSAKKTVKLSSFFALLLPAGVKAACRTLMKLTHDVQKMFSIVLDIFVVSCLCMSLCPYL